MTKKKAAAKEKPESAPQPKVALDVFAAILADISAGEPAYKAVPANGVTVKAFWADLSAFEERGKQYARAKLQGIERLAEEIVEIADESRIGEKRKTTVLKQGNGEDAIELPAEEVTTGDMVERSKLQIDSRKWLLAKMLPKKYGDKMQIGGADDLPPVQVQQMPDWKEVQAALTKV